MELITLKGISKQFSGKEVIKKVNLTLLQGRKIGLVGSNGSGKTSLLTLMHGSLEPDEGEIFRKKALNIGFLPQIPDLSNQHTVFLEALSAFSHLQKIEQELEEIHKLMNMNNASGDEIKKLIARQAQLMELYEFGGGYSYKNRTASVLTGLGFTKEEFERSVLSLSGGEKNRVRLARVLLTQPDILLLDEPTNFLDLATTEWLENELKNMEKTMVVVSHDRYFLDQTTNDTWEIERGSVKCYRGSYSSYVSQKELDQEKQMKAYIQQQEEIKRQEEFIRRNIYGETHTRAQSRRKMLEKMERIEKPFTSSKHIGLSLAPARRSGEIVVDIQNLGHSFGDRILFQRLTTTLYREEKLAIVGPNGCGKTTLLRLILGELSPAQGTVKLGQNINLGFYHQEHRDLDLDLSVFDNIKALVPAMDNTPLRGYLARFLFCGDEVDKIVGNLSGGEQSRVALAKLLISRPNFLVLDEPTNHLDIPSRQALEDALITYSGTTIFVSHDRYFIDRVATRTLVFNQDSWYQYPGNYTDYLASRDMSVSTSPQKKKKSPAPSPYPVKTQQRAKRKRQYTFEDLEKKIIETEERVEEIHADLSQEETCRNPVIVQKLTEEYKELTTLLNELNTEWESWVEEQ